MAHSVKRHLDVDADAYDVEIRRFIPYYDDMLATGVELLAALAPPTAHVLDLGGGTGALSAAVLGGLPEARVTLLDVDRAMLDEARRRLAPFGDRVEFREASFLDPLPAADAVVASLALHHVHDLDAKTNLYRAIHAALAPGGVFLNLDAAITEDPRLNALTFDRWAARMAEHGITERRGSRPLRRVDGRGPLLPAGRGARCAAARGLRRGRVLLAPRRDGDLLRAARLNRSWSWRTLMRDLAWMEALRGSLSGRTASVTTGARCRNARSAADARSTAAALSHRGRRSTPPFQRTLTAKGVQPPIATRPAVAWPRTTQS